MDPREAKRPSKRPAQTGAQQAGAQTGEFVRENLLSRENISRALFGRPTSIDEMGQSLAAIGQFFGALGPPPAEGQQAQQQVQPGQPRIVVLPDGTVVNTTSTRSDEEIIAEFEDKRNQARAQQATGQAAPVPTTQEPSPMGAVESFTLDDGSTVSVLFNPDNPLEAGQVIGRTDPQAEQDRLLQQQQQQFQQQQQQFQQLMTLANFAQGQQQLDQNAAIAQAQMEQRNQTQLAELLAGLNSQSRLTQAAGMTQELAGLQGIQGIADFMQALPEGTGRTLEAQSRAAGLGSDFDVLSQLFGGDFDQGNIGSAGGRLAQALGVDPEQFVQAAAQGNIPGTQGSDILARIFGGAQAGEPLPLDIGQNLNFLPNIQGMLSRGEITPEQAEVINAALAVNFDPEVIAGQFSGRGRTGGPSGRIVRR